MIEEVNEKDICECVNVIRVSFATVADEFGFTAENAPKFTAFATTEERLKWHLFGEHRCMPFGITEKLLATIHCYCRVIMSVS